MPGWTGPLGWSQTRSPLGAVGTALGNLVVFVAVWPSSRASETPGEGQGRPGARVYCFPNVLLGLPQGRVIEPEHTSVA